MMYRVEVHAKGGVYMDQVKTLDAVRSFVKGVGVTGDTVKIWQDKSAVSAMVINPMKPDRVIVV